MIIIQDLHQQAIAALNRRAYQQSHQYCLKILNRDQRFADAWFLMALIACDHGQIDKAIGLIDKALERDADNSEYLAQMGKCFALKHDPVQALTYAKKAEKLEQNSAVTLDTLGTIYNRIGLHKMAVSCFEQAIIVKPGKPSFYFNLATALHCSGDAAGARAALEKAITFAPQFYQAHWALAELGGDNLKRLKVLLPQVKTADDKLYLCHAIAKEYQQLGNYECSFAYLAQGKSGKLTEVGGDFAHDELVFASLHQAFAKPNNHADKTAYKKTKCGFGNAAPIFVVGMPRTGTTVVERILSNHSQVISVGETDHFAQLVKRMSSSQTNRLLDANTIIGAAGLNFTKLGKAYIDTVGAITGQSTTGMPSSLAPRFVDKMPLNVLYVGFILKALPNAKIICLERDPMDTIVSNYQKLFWANQGNYNYAYSLENTAKYYQHVQKLSMFWQQLFADSFMTVNYEKLVNSPEVESQKIMAFCDLDWQPRCINFEKHTAMIHQRSIGQWQKYQAFMGSVQTILNTQPG
ncbi:MAG: sulfotransferase [Psychrosphaera sp.]|nr:sulfotransferase [Psychrosphaera sp.]